MDEKLPKRKIPAEIELTDGAKMTVMLFVSPQGRLLDMLNDSRGFVPLETEGGETIFLRKEAIRRVAPLAAPKDGGRAESHATGPRRHGDPYELLGVSREASAAEIREAYRQRCLENHPDRLQALGLPRDFIEFATRRMAEINAAYDQLKVARAAE